ncbi:hypothetical protein BST81_14420 [Leptolyngbya sp. 'hensonii']|uniref:bifunctional 4-hydroxy-2-oxoglutarate aldolase/2-dehydro-3-deoxy-phosphogluconate aldolase n=1 Tax=Leptolyngbya sp. 'hensonii' TaxID=1922337 RepID=UPI00094FE7F3|nr:bifunctional 4-hydroxy-2-oxoglutarate aldolase/2-dehydro-3-deoxy-phosphogluconate aldolase [Leptolyngbya sp. 'hensonii']OLP17529.1 hypothetical protein BST81_14420 [Leptolyngbya sp. 'hensonii']
MVSSNWLDLVQRYRAFAVIRSPHLQLGHQMARAVAAGGMGLIEITWNGDRPTDLIAQLRQDLPHCLIGAGTLLTLADMQEAIAAGAQFLFTPHTSPELIQRAGAAGIPMIPGALSPTEIMTAWQAGAACVKVFPIQAVGGSAYITALQGPLGQIPLIPTGGVTIANTPELLRAGAVAVGLAGDLFPRTAIQTGDWDIVQARATTLMTHIRDGMNRPPTGWD